MQGRVDLMIFKRTGASQHSIASGVLGTMYIIYVRRKGGKYIIDIISQNPLENYNINSAIPRLAATNARSLPAKEQCIFKI